MNNTFSKKDLTLEELYILESEMLKRRKSKAVAWGLWAFLSFFGAHRFYTENYVSASAMLLIITSPIFMTILLPAPTNHSFLFPFSMLLIASSIIWGGIDAFFLSRRVEKLNDAIEYEIIHKIKSNR
ncbi:NINE protein [Aneurinibacillus uraniidurans]|uniref:NINE protein n=1 Tax=Aneurinibacillus uraniidurans TaxID=2966586 RepID=UPI0023496D28|nr:NINE protein [Aneurinibacillus sp. B1]WCN37911.1 NINE protein [Aneurinibacillus sp. B1]